MGRGRQKAKQQKIARKLKYLTTDTDYDELARELNGAETDDTNDEYDMYADIEAKYADVAQSADENAEEETESTNDSADTDDDLDEYAKWAAEVAAKSNNK